MARFKRHLQWRPDNSDADLGHKSSEEISITNSGGIRTKHDTPQPGGLPDLPHAGGQLCLGVKTRQLRHLYLPSTGATDNQLRTFNQLGLFYPAFRNQYLDLRSPLRHYGASATWKSAPDHLDANCAQCRGQADRPLLLTRATIRR
jgi:hypothetical protein